MKTIWPHYRGSLSTKLDNNIILIWCTFHKLTFNTKKTKAMLFSIKDIDLPPNDGIYLKGERIEHVPVYKYLGIQLDHKLKSNCQFNITYKSSGIS